MKKASDYRRHAEECRALASQMNLGGHRDQLLSMAATWDQLAVERERIVRAAGPPDGQTQGKADGAADGAD